MFTRSCYAGAAILLAASLPANAATFDFSSFTGTQPGATIVLPEGTFTGLEGRIFADGPPTNPFSLTGSVCALDAVEFRCEADMRLDFNGVASNLVFEAFNFQQGDQNTISIFSGLTLLDTIILTADGLVDFSSYSGITSVMFDDNSTAQGFEFGNFSFDLTPVPIPAALPLFATALGAAGFAGWRRRRKAVA